MEKVMECVAFVRPMFERLKSGDYAGLEQLAKSVFKVEHEADIIKNEIRQTIPKSFFLPVYRGDLLGLLALQDSMADAVEDVAVVLTIKHLELPESISKDVLAYVDLAVAVASKADAVSQELTALNGKGFGIDEVEQIQTQVSEVARSEWEADRKQYQLAKLLFAHEDEIPATSIFLWSKVCGELGALANHAEKASDRIGRMVVK
jgi:hypothetical protein